jgi:hypothetical protein
MSNQDPTDILEEGKTPPKPKDDDCQSPGTKILTVKEMKAASDYLDEFLNITENVI